MRESIQQARRICLFFMARRGRSIRQKVDSASRMLVFEGSGSGPSLLQLGKSLSMVQARPHVSVTQKPDRLP